MAKIKVNCSSSTKAKTIYRTIRLISKALNKRTISLLTLKQPNHIPTDNGNNKQFLTTYFKKINKVFI